MRKTLCFLGFIFSSLCFSAEKASVTIHVDKSYKPYSYFEDGTVKGLYIKILTRVFSKLEDFEVKFEAIPWNRGKLIMEKGRGFALAPVYFHGHDWPYLYPYSMPFYTESVMVYCNKTPISKKERKWPEGFSGLTVGNLRGFDGWGGNKFRKMIENKKITYHEVNSSDALIMMAATGRNDCILMEEFAFDYQMLKLKQTGKYKKDFHLSLYKSALAGVDPVYVGYSEPGIAAKTFPQQYKFRKAFDAALYKMQKDGEIQDIVSSFFN